MSRTSRLSAHRCRGACTACAESDVVNSLTRDGDEGYVCVCVGGGGGGGYVGMGGGGCMCSVFSSHTLSGGQRKTLIQIIIMPSNFGTLTRYYKTNSKEHTQTSHRNRLR